MEIAQLRQEINDLLENIVEHSNNYSNNKPIPSLEVSYVLSKVNKMHEKLTILKFLIEQQELSNKTSAKKLVRFPKIEEDIEETTEAIKDEQNSEPPVEVSVGQDEFVEEEIGATLENEGHETITPNLSEKKAKNIEQLPIKKIIDALTLNDRYLYANELFNKDMNAFNDLVKALDNCLEINEAKEIIAQFEAKWDEENEHVISFFNLVERRFL